VESPAARTAANERVPIGNRSRHCALSKRARGGVAGLLSDTIPTTAGGNPDLLAEVGETLTAGVIVRPVSSSPGSGASIHGRLVSDRDRKLGHVRGRGDRRRQLLRSRIQREFSAANYWCTLFGRDPSNGFSSTVSTPSVISPLRRHPVSTSSSTGRYRPAGWIAPRLVCLLAGRGRVPATPRFATGPGGPSATVGAAFGEAASEWKGAECNLS
jgi:hypothetical protein